eukprot:35195_1
MTVRRSVGGYAPRKMLQNRPARKRKPDEDLDGNPPNKKRKLNKIETELDIKIKKQRNEFKLLEKQKQFAIEKVKQKYEQELRRLESSWNKKIYGIKESVMTLIEEKENQNKEQCPLFCRKCYEETNEMKQCKACEVAICNKCSKCCESTSCDAVYCNDCATCELAEMRTGYEKKLCVDQDVYHLPY